MINQPAPLTINKTGANQVWDLSSAVGDQEITNFFTHLANTTDSNNFPSANYAEKDTVENTETFYLKTSSGLSIVEQFSPGNQVRLDLSSDPMEFLKFPLSYNDSYQETFDGTIEITQSGQTLTRSGNIEINAEGYGKLILPHDTIKNVLMVRKVLDYSDANGGNTIRTYNDTIFNWYNSSMSTYIASYVVRYSNGDKQLSSLSYIQQEDLLTGFPQKWQHYSSKIILYPNPTNESVYLSSLKHPAKIDIYNIEGQRVKELRTRQKTKKINLSDFSDGVYYIVLTTKLGSYNKRLIVK